jgi:hypothetical protein
MIQRLYWVWSDIKQRCYNKNNPAYKRYGGRGIKMCQEWKDNYILFEHWALKNGYKEKLTIDRIDNNGNYEPDNCRWADRVTQANNTRNNVYIVFENKKYTLAQLARYLNLPQTTLFNRIKNGVDLRKPRMYLKRKKRS